MSVELVNNENILKAQQGDQESINLILKNYKNFVFMNSRNYFLIGADQDDLLQEGMIGLIKAIKAYDGDKNASFKTFATICIKRQIITAIKSSNAQKNIALNSASGNFIECDDGKEISYSKGLSSYTRHNPEELYLSKEKMEGLKLYSEQNFSSFEREVFHLLIKGYSYREISEKLEKNLKTIDNTIQRIKRKSEEWIDKY
ncbi:MAG: sigma-70 family RNA polymerase sigma factor [Fusobacteriaceae bacterium]